jgi:peroxiredoxin Q/BCP
MLTKGKKAPAFSAPNQDGEIVSLKDYLGKKVAIYFYPKDDTPGCTEQACNIRDNMSGLKKTGIEIIGISVDDVKKHKKFEQKYELPFTLIADEDKKIVEKYQVWGEKKMYGRVYMGIFRTTYLINENGEIVHVIEKVDTKNHTAQILEAFGL